MLMMGIFEPASPGVEPGAQTPKSMDLPPAKMSKSLSVTLWLLPAMKVELKSVKGWSVQMAQPRVAWLSSKMQVDRARVPLL